MGDVTPAGVPYVDHAAPGWIVAIDPQTRAEQALVDLVVTTDLRAAPQHIKDAIRAVLRAPSESGRLREALCDGEQVAARRVEIPVHCAACGGEFPGSTQLHNGICDECQKLTHGPNYRLVARLKELDAENAKLREFIARNKAVAFEARCRDLISAEEYVEHLTDRMTPRLPDADWQAPWEDHREAKRNG